MSKVVVVYHCWTGSATMGWALVDRSIEFVAAAAEVNDESLASWKKWAEERKGKSDKVVLAGIFPIPA